MQRQRKQRPQKNVARAKKPAAQKDPMLALLGDMDPETLNALRQAILSEMPGIEGLFDDAVSTFEAYLSDSANGEIDPSEQNERLAALVGVLDQLRIDANGGDRDARNEMKEIHDLLTKAIENGHIDPIQAMLLGKTFSDAGWPVSDSLKQVLSNNLTTPAAWAAEPLGAPDFAATVHELAENVDQNPFELHEQLSSLFAAFPGALAATLIVETISAGEPIASQAAAGFLLHPDIDVARAVAQALIQSAARKPVVSVQIERLVRLRQWTPSERHEFIDAAIRAMRANALRPVPAKLAKTLACYASVCDGAGVRSVIVSQKIDGRYQVGTVMLKPEGVAEALMMTDLRKRQMDAIVEGLTGAAPTARVEAPALARIVGLAIAENFTANALPPFKLIEFAERLGLGPLPPEPATASELIFELLAGLPPDQTGAAAAERAQTAIAASKFGEAWFEAGEELDALLASVKSQKRREAKILNEYLPRRRAFWTRQFALSALSLRSEDRAPDATWKLLALAGRDLASDTPMDAMPLMRQIAKSTAEAYAASL